MKNPVHQVQVLTDVTFVENKAKIKVRNLSRFPKFLRQNAPFVYIVETRSSDTNLSQTNPFQIPRGDERGSYLNGDSLGPVTQGIEQIGNCSRLRQDDIDCNLSRVTIQDEKIPVDTLHCNALPDYCYRLRRFYSAVMYRKYLTKVECLFQNNFYSRLP